MNKEKVFTSYCRGLKNTFGKTVITNKRSLDLARRASLTMILGIFFFAIVFRLIDLDHLPGFYGDEAWYGIQAANLMHGRPIEWIALSNRPLINIFFFIPVFLLQLFFEPSLWILRFPSVIAGLLAVLLSYYLFHKIIGRPAAISLALLTAALPINIAYSRFGWDPSIIILYAVTIIYFALRDNLTGVLISTLLALTAHPTAICLFPIVITIALAREDSTLLPTGLLQKRTGAAILLTCNMIGAIYARTLNIAAFRFPPAEEEVPFFLNLGRLFSGETTYRHIVDLSISLGATDYSILLGTLLLLSVFFFRHAGSTPDQFGKILFPLGLGLLFSLLCGYLMTGPCFILPHAERYGVYLIFPCTLFFVVLLHGAFPMSKKYWPIAITVMLSFFLLIGFQHHYFSPLHETGGNSHLAFRTGERELKQSAYFHVLKESGGAPIRIFADGWWLWQPFLYFATNNSSVSILELREFSKPVKGDYVVTFAGERLDLAIQKEPDSYEKRWTELDYAGRSILAIYRL